MVRFWVIDCWLVAELSKVACSDEAVAAVVAGPTYHQDPGSFIGIGNVRPDVALKEVETALRDGTPRVLHSLLPHMIYNLCLALVDRLTKSEGAVFPVNKFVKAFLN